MNCIGGFVMNTIRGLTIINIGDKTMNPKEKANTNQKGEQTMNKSQKIIANNIEERVMNTRGIITMNKKGVNNMKKSWIYPILLVLVLTFGYSGSANAKENLIDQVSKVAPIMGPVINIVSSGYEIAETINDGENLPYAIGNIFGGMAGTTIGATIGTFILPGVGTAIGGIIGGIAGGKGGGYVSKTVYDTVRGN